MPLSDLWSSAPAVARPAEDVQALRRKLQTRAATFARIKKRQKQHHEEGAAAQGIAAPGASTFATSMQIAWFTRKLSEMKHGHAGYQDGSRRSAMRDQRRAVWSWFAAASSALSSALASVLSPPQPPQTPRQTLPPSYIVTSMVVDDANIRLTDASGSSTVYATMNCVQAVAMGLQSSEMSAFILHCPMLPLSETNALSLHAAMMSWSLITANGPGVKLCNPNCPALLSVADSLRQIQFKAVVWTVDSLKANVAAFKLERELLSQKQTKLEAGPRIEDVDLTLELLMKCGVHQVSLVRRPLILGVPNIWSNLVRLGHLLESRGWRTSFYGALRWVLRKSFRWAPCPHLPPNAATWSARTADVLNVCLSPVDQKWRVFFQAMCNGDSTSEWVVHYCVGDCCKDSADAFQKVVQAFSKLLRAYPPPLLYRWKHGGPALAFWSRGVCLYRMLPRVMARMGGTEAAMEHQDDVEEQAAVETPDDADLTAAQAAAQAAVDEDESFALKNRKRHKLVLQCLQAQDIAPHLLIVALMSEPADEQINWFFHRTAIIEKLLHGTAASQAKDMEAESKAMFLAHIRGEQGGKLVQKYVEILRLSGVREILRPLSSSCPTDPRWRESMTRLVFSLCLQGLLCIGLLFALSQVTCHGPCTTRNADESNEGMADAWRRLCHSSNCFPWATFSLLDQPDCQSFFAHARHLQARARCSQCADVEFTTPLLNVLTAAWGESDQRAIYASAMSMLRTVCIFGKISSDTVELVHGQIQHFSRNAKRGRFRMAETVSRESYLHSAVKEFELLQHFVEKQAMPGKRTSCRIMAQHGRKRGKKDGVLMKETKDQKDTRLALAHKKTSDPAKMRETSGWNMFVQAGSTELG